MIPATAAPNRNDLPATGQQHLQGLYRLSSSPISFFCEIVLAKQIDAFSAAVRSGDLNAMRSALEIARRVILLRDREQIEILERRRGIL